jgi:hypothetical protein
VTFVLPSPATVTVAGDGVGRPITIPSPKIARIRHVCVCVCVCVCVFVCYKNVIFKMNFGVWCWLLSVFHQLVMDFFGVEILSLPQASACGSFVFCVNSTLCSTGAVKLRLCPLIQSSVLMLKLSVWYIAGTNEYDQ